MRSAFLSFLLPIVLASGCGGGGSFSYSSSGDGSSLNYYQYGDNDSTSITMTSAVQSEDGSMTLRLDNQSFLMRVTANSYSPISEFGLSVDGQGATMQICQNGLGLFNVFPADASPVTDLAELAGETFFSVSLCSSFNLQGDSLYFGGNNGAVFFDASEGQFSLLSPLELTHRLSSSCNPLSENCLRVFRVVRNGAPLHFIHAPWPDGLRLWQGPGLY